MRLRHRDGSVLHLAYCSNVHPADDLDGVAAQLERYAARVRERLDVPVLGAGLWVAAPALSDTAAAERLRGQGYPILKGPAVHKEDGYCYLYVEDPDKNVLELIAPTAETTRLAGLEQTG